MVNGDTSGKKWKPYSFEHGRNQRPLSSVVHIWMWAKSSLDNYKRSAFLSYHWFGTRCHCKDKGTGTVFLLASSLFANFIEVVLVVRSGVKVRPNTTGEQLIPLCSSFSQEGFIFYPLLTSLPVLLTYIYQNSKLRKRLCRFRLQSIPPVL